MSATFAARLTGAEGRELRLYFRVQGVPFIFQENGTDIPASFGETAATIFKRVIKIEQAKSTLDLSTRRMVGGSLTVRLLDDDAGTLRNLFTMRKRKATFLAANVTDASTVIEVKTASSLPASGTVYVDAETINYTGNAGGFLTGASRGRHDSEAAAHRGTSTEGAGVFTAPPTWMGRRVYLYGYFLDDDGDSTPDLVERLDTFRIEEAPTYVGDNQWELQCSHLSDEFAAQKIGTNLVDVDLMDSLARDSGTGHTFLKPTPKGQRFFFETDDEHPTHVRLEWSDGSAWVMRCRGTQGAATTFEIDGENLASSPRTQVIPKKARHVVVLDGNPNPGINVVRVLTSRLGNLANGAYDVLPGYTSATYGGISYRMGAGIRADEVDTTGWRAIGSERTPWSYVIDEEQTVADFLRDVCLSTSSIWLVDKNGLLTAKRIGEERQAVALHLDDDNIVGKPVTKYREDEIAPRLTLRCNYDLISREFEKTINILDPALQARYPTREDTIQIESRSLVITPVDVEGGSMVRESQAQAEAEMLLRRIQVSSGRGRLQVALRCTVEGLLLQLGDVVSLTTSLPNLEGAATTIAARCRVVGWQPDYDGMTVDLDLDVIDRLHHVAPACVVASAAGAVMTLRTTGPEVTDATPGGMFGDGWVVDVVDISGNVRETFTVVSHTGTTVTISGTPTFTVEAGVDYLVVTAQNASAVQSDDGFLQSDFIFQQEDDESGVLLVTRWR